MAAYFRTESFPAREKITFHMLETRLIATVNARIQNGEFTERGLAKLLAISQPQMHNILKGARKLRVEVADRLLCAFGLTIIDLLAEEEHGQTDAAPPMPSGHSVASAASFNSSGAPPRKLPAQEWQFPRRHVELPR